MEQIAISKFKATCRAVLERVRRTRKSVLGTRFGKPVAEVVSPPPPTRPARWRLECKKNLNCGCERAGWML